MPGIAMEGTSEEGKGSEVNGNSETVKDSSVPDTAPNRNVSPPHSPVSTVTDPPVNAPPVDVRMDTSIEKLYENVCDMQSSDQSQSRQSYGSYGGESRIDSELHHIVGGERREAEPMEEDEEDKPEVDSRSSSSSKKGSSSTDKKASTSTDKKRGKKSKPPSTRPKSVSSGKSEKASHLQSNSEASSKSGLKGKSSAEKPPVKNPRKPNEGVSFAKKPKGLKLENGTEDSSVDKPEHGQYLLKQARELMASGDNSQKALKLALRAAKSFETCANEKNNLELAMCLHVTAAIHCSLGQYNEAIPVLERSIEIPVVANGQEHALAKFAGHMQLGDTYAMLGHLEKSLMCYEKGLEEQKQALGEKDPRVGETCRYLAEANVQALQFDEAEKFCQMALDIHRENGSPASLEEAADKRLMGLICETKGNHEAALEHLVLASMAMVANCQDVEVAFVDCSIGDAYLSLTRYDEAVFAYQKALTLLKTTKGENHPSVGSVFARLADVYNKTGKIRDSKSYCENALRIYENPMPGVPIEEIASGLANLSAIYESMNDLEQARELLQKALKIYDDAPGQQTTIAGIEAQIGVLHYMLGNYSESYNSFKIAISNLRVSGEKKSAFFGVALNQMGLACVQRCAISEAVELFEEAKDVLERECGPCHPDTLGVYSNLAGTYDALGRLDKAIDILEYVVGMREEKLGTAHPDVDDEKRRLNELLKDTGRVRDKKARSLEKLLGSNPQSTNDEAAKTDSNEEAAKTDSNEGAEVSNNEITQESNS